MMASHRRQVPLKTFCLHGMATHRRRAALGTNTATSTKLRIKTFVEAFPEDEEPNKDENTEQAPESPKAKSLFDFNIFSYKA